MHDTDTERGRVSEFLSDALYTQMPVTNNVFCKVEIASAVHTACFQDKLTPSYFSESQGGWEGMIKL